MSTHAPHPTSPSATDSAAAPLVEMRGITKIYPNGVLANHEVTFAVRAGEIHALVGENGAGKSTLMKILYGMERPSAGQIFLRGKPTTIHSPHEAITQGIGMVHQNFMLVPSFTIAENIVLGTEPSRGAFVDRRAAIAAAAQLAQQYGLSVDPEARVDVVPVGMRQRVEILKALYRGADVLILDEPTAVLTPQETHELFTAIQRLIQVGKTVIFISHKLHEVMEISDRISVMRDARLVGTLDKHEANERLLAKMMVGREVFLNIEKTPAQRGPLVLKVRNLEYATETGVEVLKGVSLSVYAGEILGIAGVEGNGQTELVEVIAGLRTPLSGVIELNGKSIAGLTPRQVRQAGVAHIPEDRLTNGVALTASIQENLIVDRYTREPFTRGGLMRPAAIARNSEALIEAYAIRAPDGSLPVGALSGGNMQKVVVARELSSQPKLLIAAQPTRGVDIGATEFMHEQLVRARNAGVAILLVSADLSEVMSLSDRLAVMHAGRIVALFPSTEGLTEEEVGLYMLGTKTMSQSEIESHW